MQLKRLALAFLLLASGSADAQPFNISSVLKPGETVFDNSFNPWSFVSATPIPGIAFDNGGSGIAYSSLVQNLACSAIGTSYRADYIVGNFKNSTLSPANAAIPYQICTTPGDWYQFTISNTQSGPFTVTLYTVNNLAGAVWSVSIDGVVVTTITTPGNGAGFATVLPATSGSFNMTQGNHLLRFTAATAASDGNTGDFVQWQAAVASGGTVACDYGPPAPLPSGAAGTDLAAAKFTHCLVNADFRDTSGVMGGHGWVMNDMTTWSNQCGGTRTWGKFFLGWLNAETTDADSGPNLGSAPCNRLSFVTENGVRALSYSFLSGDFICCANQANGKVGLALWWPFCGSTCKDLRPGLPVALYMESVWRLSSGLSQPTTVIIDSEDQDTSFLNLCPNPATANGCGLDMVMAETYPNTDATEISLDNYWGTTGDGICGGKCNNGWAIDGTVPGTTAPFMDHAHYHKYADLTTTDGPTTLNTCIYLDDASGFGPKSFPVRTNPSGACGQWVHYNAAPLGSSPGEIAGHDRRFFHAVMLDAGSQPPAFNPITVLIQRITIFTCNTPLGQGNDCTTAQSGGQLVYH